MEELGTGTTEERRSCLAPRGVDSNKPSKANGEIPVVTVA